MKKNILVRALLGFPLGVWISYTITIVFSLALAEGIFWAVTPVLIPFAGGEMQAVVLQYFLSGLLGAVCCASSCVWEAQDWSLLKQTVVHFVMIVGSMLPVAWVCGWMPRDVKGAVLYIILFLVIYICIFIGIFLYWKRKIKEMNSRIHEENGGN